MDTWIEVDDGCITNQPLISVSSGKGRKKVPDPDKPPTQMFLACYHCRRLKSGRIQRSRFMEIIEASDSLELYLKLVEFVLSPGHVLIETVDNPIKFISDGQEANEFIIEEMEPA